MTILQPSTYLNDRLANPSLKIRILTAALAAVCLFTTVTILSYYVLPEGFLRNRDPLHNWQTSPALWISTLQIFSFNLLSVIMICFGNLFATRKSNQQYALPYGMTAFFVMITINAIVVGTWSFSIIQPSVNLVERFMRMFDLAHRAGLWEMTGQLLIACATTGLARIITANGQTTVLPWNTVHLSRIEWMLAILGLVLMACGAFIESAAILSVV